MVGCFLNPCLHSLRLLQRSRGQSSLHGYEVGTRNPYLTQVWKWTLQTNQFSPVRICVLRSGALKTHAFLPLCTIQIQDFESWYLMLTCIFHWEISLNTFYNILSEHSHRLRKIDFIGMCTWNIHIINIRICNLNKIRRRICNLIGPELTSHFSNFPSTVS